MLFRSLELGELLAAHGDIGDATALLRRTMYAGDSYSAPLASLRLGTVLQEAGDFQAAKTAFKRALRIGPPKVKAEASQRLRSLPKPRSSSQR